MIKRFNKFRARLQTATDEPKKWNCCDMLVKPSELAEHVKKYHWGKT